MRELFGKKEEEKRDVTKVIQKALMDSDEEGEDDEEEGDDKDTSLGWEAKDSGEEIEDNKDNKASKMAMKKIMKNPLYRKNKEDSDEDIGMD